MDRMAQMWSFITAMGSPTLPNEGRAGDGREEALLKEVLATAERNPESVLSTIDRYSRRTWMMSIGDQKGKLLTQTLTAANPLSVLELGAYVGYSATLISSNLKHDASLVSLEMSSLNADITRQIVDHAGLADKVEVVQGILTDKVEDVKQALLHHNHKRFDFVFIDHDKNYYLSDLLLLKSHGLVGKGTVLFADNMRIPGSPQYRDYMNKHKDEFDTVEHKTGFEYLNWLPDSVFVSICK